MEQVKTKSVEPQQRFALSEISWDDLNEAGAYVERGSRDLYRLPKEALIPGGSPIIRKESIGASRLVQVSKIPFVTTLEARLRCAQHNIEPNFQCPAGTIPVASGFSFLEQIDGPTQPSPASRKLTTVPARNHLARLAKLGKTETIPPVIIHHAGGLHQRIADC
jgi:hypothetical protein